MGWRIVDCDVQLIKLMECFKLSRGRQDRQFTADPKATLVKIISAYKANLIYREGKLSKYKSLEVKIVALHGRI